MQNFTAPTRYGRILPPNPAWLVQHPPEEVLEPDVPIVDAHVQARALVADYPDEDMGQFPMHAVPARLSNTPGAIRAPAPRLGQHTRDILAEAGLAEAEIAASLSNGLARSES